MAAPIGTVAITGGTHGNEANGVELARHFLRNIDSVQRPSFRTTVTITNPAAVNANTRYIDEDLNRCFLKSDLADESRQTLEARRAREVNQILGPKGSDGCAVDLIIDLHNTTAATGVALLMAPGDALCHAIAARLQEVDSSVRIANWTKGAADYPLLPSIAPHGMTFEVGPAPWGCLEPASYAQSLRLVHAALDYVHSHNLALKAGGPWREISVPVFCSAGKPVDYPRHADGTLAAMIHPSLQGHDFTPLKMGDPIFQTHGLETIRFGEMSDGSASHAAVAALCGEVYPFFINEAAYYEKGVAFALATQEQRMVKLAGSTI